MESSKIIGSRVFQVKSSLDELQNIVGIDEYSSDSLYRLNRALKDINEEVDMLKTVLQVSSRRD